MKELVGPDVDMVAYKKCVRKARTEELTLKAVTLRKGERRGQVAFVDTPRIGRNKRNHPLVDSNWTALCQTLYDGVAHEDWEKERDVVRRSSEHHVSIEGNRPLPVRC